MADYFGYSKEAYGPGNIVSASMVMVKINSGTVRLAQDVGITYQRNSGFVFELGSDSVWLNAGQSSGTVQMTRTVGDEKMLKPYKPSSACDTDDITMSRGRGQCGMDPGTITAGRALLVSVGIQASAGGLQVNDNAQYNCGILIDS